MRDFLEALRDAQWEWLYMTVGERIDSEWVRKCLGMASFLGAIIERVKVRIESEEARIDWEREAEIALWNDRYQNGVIEC